MKRFVVAGVLCAGLMAPLLSVPAGAAPGDVAVSDRTYVRYDGGTDPVLAACSINNRQQNEPAASVAPHNPALMSLGFQRLLHGPDHRRHLGRFLLLR